MGDKTVKVGRDCPLEALQHHQGKKFTPERDYQRFEWILHFKSNAVIK